MAVICWPMITHLQWLQWVSVTAATDWPTASRNWCLSQSLVGTVTDASLRDIVDLYCFSIVTFVLKVFFYNPIFTRHSKCRFLVRRWFQVWQILATPCATTKILLKYIENRHEKKIIAEKLMNFQFACVVRHPIGLNRMQLSEVPVWTCLQTAPWVHWRFLCRFF